MLGRRSAQYVISVSGHLEEVRRRFQDASSEDGTKKCVFSSSLSPSPSLNFSFCNFMVSLRSVKDLLELVSINLSLVNERFCLSKLYGRRM